jgi:hypothetical protein
MLDVGLLNEGEYQALVSAIDETKKAYKRRIKEADALKHKPFSEAFKVKWGMAIDDLIFTHKLRPIIANKVNGESRYLKSDIIAIDKLAACENFDEVEKVFHDNWFLNQTCITFWESGRKISDFSSKVDQNRKSIIAEDLYKFVEAYLEDAQRETGYYFTPPASVPLLAIRSSLTSPGKNR